jgi:hypothetical protein
VKRFLVSAAFYLFALPPIQLAAAETQFGTDAESLAHEARRFAVALDDPGKHDVKLAKQYESFCKWIAIQGPSALSTIRTLLADPSPEIQAFGGELLVACAYGDRYPSYDASRPAKRTIVPTGDLGCLAAELMDSPDPFLAGLGEWAIAIRLGDEYEGRLDRRGTSMRAMPWPGDDAPQWYKKWHDQGPQQLLQNDYVRQAVAAGAHRSAKALARSADSLVHRAEKLIGYVRNRGTASQIAAADQAMEKVVTAQASLHHQLDNRPTDIAGHHRSWLDLRQTVRGVCLANTDINFRKIVFALRRGDGGGGNITMGRNNASPPGGDIVVKTGLAPGDPVTPLIQGRLGPGHVKGMELWFDADRLVFAYAKQPEAAAHWEQAHLFEMNLDGANLRQLTEGKHSTDQEPTYLPNGDIVFVSDRSCFGSQCAGALEQDNMILNLFRCDPDGRNLRPLSNNKDFDRHPHMMDNGQLLFLHWEYLDRHLWQTHTLWTCHPDGTLNDAIYKQHITSGPMSLREARQIPGQQRLVAVACGHHNSDVGAIMLVDYTRGINNPEGMENITPDVSSTEGGYGRGRPVPEGAVRDCGGYYRFPSPLSDKSFLVSYSYDTRGQSGYGLYYIDVWGNEELIHRDLQTSVAFLSPLRKVPRPHELPEMTAPASDNQRFARVYLHNVYDDLPGVARGTVKHLRIAQPMPWPSVKDEGKGCGFNDLHYMASTGWSPAFGMWGWGASRAIGIVPVEEDGSAYFKAPADQPVFFQALDKDYTEVRRMRSYVTFMNGESRSCIGCHESRTNAPPRREPVGTAAHRAPSQPAPPAWGDRVLPDYETHIQPILDRRCVSCHGEKAPAGGVELTSRKIHHYNQSYRALFGLKPTDPTPAPASGFWKFWYPDEPAPCDETISKSMLRAMHRNEQPGQLVLIASRDLGADITPPLAYGSSLSRLTRAVLEHRRKDLVKDLTDTDWIALVTWVDLNAQYWGTYVDKDSYSAKMSKTCRRVKVIFPDPWQAPPAGEWYWVGDSEVHVRPLVFATPAGQHGVAE